MVNPLLLGSTVLVDPPREKKKKDPHMALSLLSVSLKLVIEFRTHPDNPGQSHLEVLNHICKDPFFPNKVTFTGPGFCRSPFNRLHLLYVLLGAKHFM